MSFLGGAECSTAGNPLSQFTKHVQDDKSLQRDRLVGRGPGGMQEGMRNQALGGPQEQMLNDFMHESNQLPQNAIPASPFAMDQMRRDLEQASHIQRNGSPGWAAEFDPGMEAAHVNPAFQHQQPASFSTAEFNNFQHLGPTAVSGEASPMGYQRPMGYGMGRSGLGMGMGMGGMGMGMRPFQSTDVQRPVSELKGKGRMVELDEKDWEAEFAQLESAGQQNLDALDAEANAAMERELNGIDRSVLSETNEFGDFESIWRGIQAETANARALVDEENFAHMGDLDQWDSFDGNNTLPSLRVPQMGDYLFEESNPFKEVTDPFSEGLAILQNGGNLSLAALAFEAAVQKDPQHVEAWTKLGAAQAQNEKESPAIRALEQALKIDPSNLEALMGLAVSYTNEGYDSTAYRTLERWIATKYPSLIGVEGLSSPADVGFTDRNMLHEKVTDLFIRAAQMSPSGEQMDPDVQVGLGVLFYGAEEYDKAVDCFGAALESTEDGTTNQQDQVHLLWNRLGATLANSGRSEEAIDAYENALAQRPNFVRARYNLGVSCINIGCFEEAAQHLLGALAMHKVVEREGREKAREVVGDGVSDGELERMISQNQSTNLYDTLRRVFSQMDRRDLGDMVGPGMDVDKFREWYLLRRSALRAISSAPSASFLVKPRAFTTVTSSTFKARPQCIVSPLQKRFNSDEAKPTEATTTEETAEQNDTTEEHASAAAEVEDQSTEAQKPTVGDAVDSAAQTVKETVNSAIGATADALSADDPVKRTLYIGNLFFEVGEDQVRKEFARFGNIKSSRLITDARGLSKGFCYIEYESQAEASEAIENMNQRVFEGRRITVQFHRPRGPKEERLKMRPQGPSKTLFIGNMSFDMSDKDLNDLFREIRNVIDVRVAIDRRTGQPRGFAHADFVDVASAEKAKAMLDRKQIHGRELRVDFSMSSGRYDNSRERSE